jgi:hypothetical protein
MTQLEQLQEEVLRKMAVTLLQIQGAEKALKTCISFVFPPPNATTIEMVEAQAEIDRKKTLKKLIDKLKEHVEVTELFDKQLSQFISERNQFAHDFLGAPGVDFKTEAGLKKGIEFLNGVGALAVVVQNMIRGFLNAILGADAKVEDDDKKYMELAKRVIQPKV